MGIADLFRPKHRHSDPQIRANAVRELTEDEAELVASIARSDDHPTVRKIAIDKIDDPEVLVDVAADEPERSLRERAQSRAAEIWVSLALKSESEADGRVAIAGLVAIDDQKSVAEIARRAGLEALRAAAMEKLTDAKALAELAKTSRSPETRAAAVALIRDQMDLRSLAVDTNRKDVGFAAVDRIDDAELLDYIATKGKNKAVRGRARKKLSEMDTGGDTRTDEEKRERAERSQLARTVEKLAKGHEWVESLATVDEAKAAWDALGPCHDDKLAKRFTKACDKYARRREKYGAAVAKKAAADAAAAKAKAEAEARAAQREARKAEGGAQDQDQDQSQDQDQAQSQDQDQAQEAAPAVDPVKAARARKEQQRQRNLAELSVVTEELEGAGDDVKLKTADRLLQGAKKVFRKVGEELPDDVRDQALERFKAARDKLFIRLQELREADEWQRWSNVPRKEKLIAEAEALLEAEVRNLGNRLKQVQAEWKKIGPVPHKKSQEMWDKFKETCDKVYERVRSQRKEQQAAHAENLTKKRELVARAEELSESSDWEGTAEAIKALQREWKAVGPVARKHSDAVWKAFRAACDKFFERRKPHLEQALAGQTENLEKKQKLCERVEALAEADDFEAAAEELRDIQFQWRKIGHVPRKDMGALRDRFRAANDAFRARREEVRAAKKAERAKQIDELRAEVDTLMKPAEGDAPDGAAVAERTLAVRAKVRELDLSSSEMGGLLAALNGLYKKVVAAHPDAFAGTELDPEASRKKKEKLCARIEELLPEKEEAPPAQTAEEMADRLRNALAENALGADLGNQLADGRTIDEAVAELKELWERTGPVPGPDGEALERRFSSACDRNVDSGWD